MFLYYLVLYDYSRRAMQFNCSPSPPPPISCDTVNNASRTFFALCLIVLAIVKRLAQKIFLPHSGMQMITWKTSRVLFDIPLRHLRNRIIINFKNIHWTFLGIRLRYSNINSKYVSRTSYG